MAFPTFLVSVPDVWCNRNLRNLDRRLLPTPTGLLTTPDSFINDGRQFFIKASYLYRF